MSYGRKLLSRDTGTQATLGGVSTVEQRRSSWVGDVPRAWGTGKGWNVLVLFVLVTVATVIGTALASWGALLSVSLTGFSSLVVDNQLALVRQSVGLQQQFGRRAVQWNTRLLTLASPLVQQDLDTDAALLRLCFPMIKRGDLSAIYIGKLDGRLIGMERETLSDEVHSLVSVGPDLIVSTVDAFGNPLLPVFTFEGYNATQRDWFLQGTNPAYVNGSWTTMYVSGSVGFNTVTWTRPLVVGGVLRGVIGADVSTVAAFKVIKGLRLSASGRGAAWLYGSEGALTGTNNETLANIIHRPEKLFTVVDFPPGSTAHSAMQFLGKQARINTSDPSAYARVISTNLSTFSDTLGEDWLITVATLRSVGSASQLIVWVLIVPSSDMYAQFRQGTTIGLAISLGAFVPAFSTLVAILVWLIISRPLKAVEAGLNNIGNELEFDTNPRTRAPYHCLKYSPIKEISSLQRSYDRLRFGLSSFPKFVPLAVAERLLLTHTPASLGVSDAHVTSYFSQIAYFSDAQNQMSPFEVIVTLKDYFESMTGYIEAEGGVLGDYLGDKIFAFWNDMSNTLTHAARACEAALLQQESLVALRAQWKRQGIPQFRVHIGINTGIALAGNVGSSSRFKYTLIGDSVNLASRLQSLNKNYGSEVVMGESTWKEPDVQSRYVVRVLDLVAVKGKVEGTLMLELLARRADASPELLELERTSFIMLEHYKARRFEQCMALLMQMLQQRPEDVALTRFIHRVQGYIERGVPDGWVGVEVMTAK